MLDQVHNHPTTVYAAIELSKKSWVVAIMHPAKGQPSIHRIKGGALADLTGQTARSSGAISKSASCLKALFLVRRTARR